MKSSKITSTNTNVEASNNLLVKAKDYNKVIDDLEYLYPKTNQRFEGTIHLDHYYIQYANYTVNTALEVKLHPELITGSSAEIRLIGDGATTPTFNSAFTASTSSTAYDNTLAVINKVVFYYDGVTVWYSNTVL